MASQDQKSATDRNRLQAHLQDDVMRNLRSSNYIRGIIYWAITGLFCFMFVFSAIWSLVDMTETKEVTRKLGYPEFIVIPLAIAKLFGVIAILVNKYRTIKEFAFAGFLYDVVLATLGHYYHPNVDTGIELALFGLFLWFLAYYADKRYRVQR